MNHENKIIIVNTRLEKCDFYVGRNSGLGNPYSFKNGDFDLETSLYLYEKHLISILNEKNSKGYSLFLLILEKLKKNNDIKLGCFCKKKKSSDPDYCHDHSKCHAYIIKSELLKRS